MSTRLPTARGNGSSLKALFKCHPLMANLSSSGLPPILCNIIAITPIMTQFLSLHPCNNLQRLWVIWRYILCYSDATSADEIRCDIYYQSIFWTKPENHLNESSENISCIQAKYNRLIAIHRPISVSYALPLTAWHFVVTFRKPIFAV